MSGTQRLLEALSDGRFHSHDELYREVGAMIHSRAADLRKKGYTITVRREWSPSQRRNFWFYRLARQTGSVGPSVSEESGSTGDPADPVGRVPREAVTPEEAQARTAAPALSPPPQTTQATGPPVGEPETRPTLFDMPAAPAWS